MTPEARLFFRQAPEVEEEIILREAVQRENDIFVNTEYDPIKLKVVARDPTSRLLGFAEVGSKDGKIGLFSFQVHPDSQGQGVGTGLLQQMVTYCRQSGMTELRAETLPQSISERILIKNGFQVVEPPAMLRELMGNNPRTLLRYFIPPEDSFK